MSIETKLESPLVSVIVPVYNVAGYLSQCLDSIINQTYTKIEVILVNDGSSDKSGEICDEYAKQDDRIIVFHKENGGASVARNHGIRNAHGEYVYFADSDDYLELNAIQTLVALSVKYHVDCIFFEAHNFAETKSVTTKANSLRFHCDYPVTEGRILIPKLIGNKDFRAAPFQYFMKRSAISNLWFEEGIMFEDELFSFQMLLKCQTVMCLRQILYKRRVHDGSVMTSKGRGIFRFHSISTIFERVLDIYRKDSNSVVKAYLVRIGILLFTRHDELSDDEKSQVKEQYARLCDSIKHERFFHSIQLRARYLGYFPWFVLSMPQRMLRKIRSCLAGGQRRCEA